MNNTIQKCKACKTAYVDLTRNPSGICLKCSSPYVPEDMKPEERSDDMGTYTLDKLEYIETCHNKVVDACQKSLNYMMHNKMKFTSAGGLEFVDNLREYELEVFSYRIQDDNIIALVNLDMCSDSKNPDPAEIMIPKFIFDSCML